MIKTLLRVIITILLLILSIIFFKLSREKSFKSSYTSIMFDQEVDLDKTVKELIDSGFEDIVYSNNITLPMNTIPNTDEMSLREIRERVDINDYRNDAFTKTVSDLFLTNDGDQIIYIKIDKDDFFENFKLSRRLNRLEVEYRWVTPYYFRYRLNFISTVLILVLLGLGCKKRTILSILTLIASIFVYKLSTLYGYLSLVSVYVLILLIIESLSLSNRYVKRNDLGLLRFLLALSVFLMPTFIPGFLDSFYNIKAVVPTEAKDLSYNSLKDNFSIKYPGISNFYTHYAYQKSYLYGRKYLFPKASESIIIEEFNRVEHYLVKEDRTVMAFNEDFFNSFISYCESTKLGNFYLDFGIPFKLEEKTFISLYIIEKEYMISVILTFIILLSFLLYKKKKRYRN